MYHIEEKDVDRFQKILDQLKHNYPWDGMHANICAQVGPIEFQIQKWWADRINCIDQRVAILNGGIGYFSVPFAYEMGAKKIDLYDMDPITENLSWYVNGMYKPEFVHHQKNVIFDKREIDNADVYINTSCEHSYHMRDIIPPNRLCVMSGNNLTARGHINLFKNMRALKKSVGFKDVLYETTMEFTYHDDMGKRPYKQFLVIGIKS